MPSTPRVLLIGWDAADWRFINPLLDAGRMPNLAKLVEGGVIGNLATLQPCLSPILWTSIATGKTADKHGIAGFLEPIPGGQGVRPSSSASRRTKALWNILSQSGKRSVVVNWYASHPAEAVAGVVVADAFFNPPAAGPDAPRSVVAGSVHPPELASMLEQFRLHPLELIAEDFASMLPSIAKIDFAVDPLPAQLMQLLAKTITIQSVATGAIESEVWDLFAVYFDGLDTGGHLFMPFHPPRLPHVDEAQFEYYRHVMTELYVLHDQMLGRLMQLAGDDVTVMLVSDHGFHCDHRRPTGGASTEEAQAALWHRQFGIIAMQGPGIVADERIYGSTLLDVAPTVLHALQLPIGQDMDGKPLLQAFENPAPIRSVPSWDDVPGESGWQQNTLQHEALANPVAVAQLIALGYLPTASAEAGAAASIVRQEANFNLAVVHGSMGRFEPAISQLTQLCEECPVNGRYRLTLARMELSAGRFESALKHLESMKGESSVEVDLLAAAALANLGRSADAEARTAPWAEHPAAQSVLGQLHAAQNRWADAARHFDAAIAADDDNAFAHHGRAQAAVYLGEFDTAARHALRAVGLLFFFPEAHATLGRALHALNEPAQAMRSLKIAVGQDRGCRTAVEALDALRAEHPFLYDSV